MMRYLPVILLLSASLGLPGCADVEPPVQARASVAPAPSEPNDAGSQEAALAVGATHASPVQESEPVDGDQPPAVTAPDSNDPGPAELDQTATKPDEAVAQPRHADTPRPQEAAAVVQEPNTVRATHASPLQNRYDGSPLQEHYAGILAAYVREDGLVNYGDLRRRRLELKPVLTELDELDPNVYRGWSRQEKLAFWINAYNLKMLDIIVRNYPIESSWWLRLTWPPSDIRHIKGIWSDYKFIVMDEEFTLAEVEQRFFRRGVGGPEGTGGFETRPYEDPRVYLAITYASQSSPPLRVQPYRGEELDRQLDDQVKAFLASPRGLQIDRANKVVRLSALFKPGWRGKEFVARYGTDKKFKSRDPETRAVLSFLTNYLSREEVEFLEVENYAIEYLNFDWRLNDTAKGY